MMDRYTERRESPTARVGNVPFLVANLAEATTTIGTLISERIPIAVRLSNAYCVVLANRSADYGELFQSGGLTFADGAPVVLVQRLSGYAKAGRVRGPSLFYRMLETGRFSGTRHLFFGGSQEVARELVVRARQKFPAVHIVDSVSPPYSDDIEEIISAFPFDKVEDSDVIWVGLGTPKQDFVASALAERVSRPVIAVGAAFDFLAGTTPEAPRFVSAIGLEWLYRLVSEPRRLWRRYLIGNFAFIRIAAASLRQMRRDRAAR